MTDKDKVQTAFEEIVAGTHGVSHFERIVGLIYDFDDEVEQDVAGLVYLNERSSAQDLFFPNVHDALTAHPDFHVFLANFLEQQPDARVFIGLDVMNYRQSRYAFDQFVVGKTRLCSAITLPSVDASLVMFDIGEDEEGHEGFESITDGDTVWEQWGDVIKTNMILEGTDVDTAVLTRMVLDGTSPLLRILIATHPKVSKPILKALLEQADPIEYHLLSVIQHSPAADDEVREKAKTLGDD